ncbi:MAG: Cyclopentanol dehydrogenase [Verrucomicrobiota bacterium]|jgi:NAD(P)-dependent dehydrogenase (short-subunit alcohol dehydrogenase family)
MPAKKAPAKKVAAPVKKAAAPAAKAPVKKAAAPAAKTLGSGKLAGKLAAITGGASGIGRAIAETFAAEGAKVLILDVNADNGKDTLAAIKKAGGQADFAQTDITDFAAVDKLFKAAAKKHGSFDVLVNSAGIAAVGNIETCSPDEFDRVMNVNIKGTFNTCKAAVGLMKGKKGSIVNLASVASRLGLPDRLAYGTSKGAVLTMTYSIATDYVKHGIRCNAIAPARVHTPFVDGFLKKNYPGKEAEMFAKLSATQPIGRMGQPSEIAAAALFLASDDAGFITGTCLDVDGGFVHCKLN